MSKPTVQFTSVNPETVRAFGEEKGLLPKGQRGLFPAAVIKAYNKGKKKDKQYNPHAVYAPHITVTVKPKGKPPVRKTFAVPALRAQLAEAGLVSATSRGRIPEAKAKEFVLASLTK